ncbi:bacteriocin family protein [Alkaliphilus serpentinus]|uniref:Type 1 encapsulin shell protein n=1 Tax=Alkaliphilus serpentinus TaxID=1482731 RepID=A0A833HLK5_9FIRM|nr:bacteriocin family protein [Alkaliphilus serpentinus]
MLKRDLAPLSQEAWEEIDSRAADVLKSHLSARKVIKVNGPKGWDYSALPKGRLDLIEEEEGGVCSGLYSVQPLIETRISFELDRWEMDNVIRGAKDIDLEPLEEAAHKIAMFEENAVYNGYQQGQIQGLIEATSHNILLGRDANSIMEALSKGMLILQHAYSNGPYTLIVGDKGWNLINMVVNGYPLKKTIEALLGSPILYSPIVKDALLIPYDHEDLEFTIGQDFSIGYESHDSKKVKLFITESFTFRVLDSNIIVKYSL